MNVLQAIFILVYYYCQNLHIIIFIKIFQWKILIIRIDKLIIDILSEVNYEKRE